MVWGQVFSHCIFMYTMRLSVLNTRIAIRHYTQSIITNMENNENANEQIGELM